MCKRSRKGTDVPMSGSRTEPKYELSDEQWQLIADLFPHKNPSDKGGRPRAEPHACVEGILWILWTGARWKYLPNRFPSRATCWRRLKDWTEAGIWERACRRLIFLCKKRRERVGKTKRGKGTKIMVLTDGCGLPLAVNTTSASPHEVTLIEPLLERRVIRRKPRRLLYEAAADSDPLRARFRRHGIELICPHRRNRSKPPTQDGRKLRRYHRHWQVERSISWLQNFRRAVIRYEYHAHIFHGFVQLACLMVVINRF